MKKKTKAKKGRKMARAKTTPARSAKKAVKKRAKKPLMASAGARRRAGRPARGVRASGTRASGALRSSLTSRIGLASREDSPAYNAGQSGDLQGVSMVADADPESVAELLEDGQALEAEIVEGVEDAPDEKPVPSRGRIEDDSVPDYDDRNKI